MVEVSSEKTFRFTVDSSFFLDMLRVLASQAVLFGHAISYYGVFQYIQPPRGVYVQNIAVVVFFIVSGLLITKNLIKAYRTNNFLEYFSDRFVRIYITLVPCLIFIGIIDYAHKYYYPAHYAYGNAFNVQTFLGNVFMLQDYPINFSITSYGSGRPLWTLAIEWWIYLSAGFFIYIWKKYELFDFKSKVLTILLFLISFIVPWHNLYSGRGGCLTLFWLLGSVIYCLLCYDSQLHSKHSNVNNVNTKKIHKNLLCVCFAAPIFFIYKNRVEYDLRLAITLGLLLYTILAYTQRYTINYSIKIRKITSFMASYSFSLYLTHYSILDILCVYESDFNKYTLLIIATLLTNLVAIALYFLGEKHYRKCQEKFKQYIDYRKNLGSDAASKKRLINFNWFVEKVAQ